MRADDSHLEESCVASRAYDHRHVLLVDGMDVNGVTQGVQNIGLDFAMPECTRGKYWVLVISHQVTLRKVT